MPYAGGTAYDEPCRALELGHHAITWRLWAARMDSASGMGNPLPASSPGVWLCTKAIICTLNNVEDHQRGSCIPQQQRQPADAGQCQRRPMGVRCAENEAAWAPDVSPLPSTPAKFTPPNPPAAKGAPCERP